MSGISGMSMSNLQSGRMDMLKQLQQNMKDIESSIQSGDLAGAKEALSNMESSVPPPPPPGEMQGMGPEGMKGKNSFETDLETLSEALNADDLQAAKDAMAQITTNMNGASKGINAYKENQMQSQASKMQETMTSLSEALESGDLEAAKSSFSKLKGMMPPMGPPPSDTDEESAGEAEESSTTTDSINSTEETLADYIKQLEEALEADDLDTAREAFTKIQDSAKSMPKGPPPEMMSGASMFSNLSLLSSGGTIDTAV